MNATPGCRVEITREANDVSLKRQIINEIQGRETTKGLIIIEQLANIEA